MGGAITTVMTTRDETYYKLMESVAAEYGPKALDLLKSIAGVCDERGLATVGPYDLSDGTYRWSMKVWPTNVAGPLEDCIDLTVEIAEEREYEGGDGYGLNFGLDIVAYAGRFLGAIAPYNFTPLVWVDARAPDEVAERWSLLESADHTTIPDLILERT